MGGRNTHERARDFEETQREGNSRKLERRLAGGDFRARVYLAGIVKIRDCSHSMLNFSFFLYLIQLSYRLYDGCLQNRRNYFVLLSGGEREASAEHESRAMGSYPVARASCFVLACKTQKIALVLQASMMVATCTVHLR